MRKEMSYLDNLKTEANYTRTLNGAKTHGSTGDACLDFFAVAGGMRYRSPEDQIRQWPAVCAIAAPLTRSICSTEPTSKLPILP